MCCVVAVDADEIRRLGKRFKKLDLDNSGSLSVDEFMSLPELQQNPLVQRVIDIFDEDGNGEVDFKGESSSNLSSFVNHHVNISWSVSVPPNSFFLLYMWKGHTLEVQSWMLVQWTYCVAFTYKNILWYRYTLSADVMRWFQLCLGMLWFVWRKLCICLPKASSYTMQIL